MIVMKFGGSSVGNAKRIRKVTEIIKSQEQNIPVIVVSALGGITDNLLDIATDYKNRDRAVAKMNKVLKIHNDTIRELDLNPGIIKRESGELADLVNGICSSGEATPKTRDHLASFGERFSARIVAAYMTSTGLEARACDAFDIGFVTDSNFEDADILPETYANVREKLIGMEAIPVITGFIGKDRQGDITTLGRGGSDYTASIIGAAINAKEIQIWTNTDGVMTADPKIVSNAKNVKTLSYEEESELEALGATNLNPKGIKPAMDKNIPVRILNTFNPEHKGTLIHRDAKIKSRVASITYRKDIKVISISAPKMTPKEGFMRKIVESFDRHGIPIKTLSTSSQSISVAIDEKHDTERVAEELGKIAKVSVMKNMAQISLVGNGVMYVPDINETLSSSLSGMNAELISSSNPKVNSVVIKERHVVKAVRLLHSIFFGR